MASNNTHLLSRSSGGQKSNTGLTELKSRYHRTVFLLEAPGQNRFPSFFRLLEAAHIPWPGALRHSNLCFCCHLFSLVLLPPYYKNPCHDTGPTWIAQGHLPAQILNSVTPAKSLLPHQVTDSLVQGLGHRGIWGPGEHRSVNHAS